MEVEKSLAASACKQFEEENLVCPASLRKGFFTVGALDNIDHNPSATTSQGAFHGTAISIFQFPTPTNSGISRDTLVIDPKILVFIFIRAHRQNNFDLYLESLEAIVPWFFALDHVNYARWIPIHIRDMKTLSPDVKEQLKNFWVIQKTENKFSSMPIDQAHEQNNEVLRGSGGLVGLTENPSAFKPWMIAGPEQSRLLTEFESQFLESTSQTNLNRLFEVISNMGNPFKDDCPELLTLDSQNCTSEDVISTVRTVENVGSTQYKQYVKDVIQDRSVKIQEPFKKNSLALFKRPQPKKSMKLKQQVAI